MLLVVNIVSYNLILETHTKKNTLQRYGKSLLSKADVFSCVCVFIYIFFTGFDFILLLNYKRNVTVKGARVIITEQSTGSSFIFMIPKQATSQFVWRLDMKDVLHFRTQMLRHIFLSILKFHKNRQTNNQ